MLDMARTFFILFTLAVVFMPLPGFAACDDHGQAPCSKLGHIDYPAEAGNLNPELLLAQQPTPTTISETLVFFLNWFAWFVGLASVAMGLYSGFLFISARDDAKQLETAKKTILYAIIGIVVSIISFSLIAITKTLF